MRFFLDHDVPLDVAIVLRARGHDALQLREALPSTAPDEDVVAYARDNRRIMVSCNRAHFIALALKAQIHPGLIILIRRRTRQAEAARLLDLLANAGEQGLANNINFA